jgi:hypothetical protein
VVDTALLYGGMHFETEWLIQLYYDMEGCTLKLSG